MIGADPGEAVATDNNSINPYKVLSAALTTAAQHAPGRKHVVSQRSNFPTDLYIAEALCQERGYQLQLVEPEEISASLNHEVAVPLLTHVN